MCGIIGFVGTDDAVNYITDGLTILENRGYDSAGVATLAANGNMVVTKFASRGTADAILALKASAIRHSGHRIGIGHTRWATHGGKTDQNAHPHADQHDRIAVVHNGVIENSHALRAELAALGVPFRSETDTEVISQLIGHYLDTGASLVDAVKKSLTRLEGTWGLGIISTLLPDTIIAARNGSPLVVGIGDGRMFIASEPSAFGPSTRNFISLENGELALITKDGHSLDVTRVQLAPEEMIALSPAPFPHWTIKEITEQPEAVSRTLNHGARIAGPITVKLGGLDRAAARLLGIRHLVIAACGTSYHAGLYGALAMRAMQAFDTIQVVDASELTYHHFPAEHAGLLVISQSGETKDVHRALHMAEGKNVPVFSVVNAVGSLIARTTQCGVYLNAGREHAVASTKAFVTQVTALELIATWFAQHRNAQEERRRKLIEDLHRLPTNLGLAIDGTREAAARVAALLATKEHCFILGKGASEPIAHEAALKIKEIGYIHAEGYAGGALKHGPFALIEPGTPVFLNILNDKHAQLMRTAAEEVRARGAYTIVVTDEPALADRVADDVIVIPRDGVLTALLSVIPYQRIAYELAVLKGINPDKPRNLAKAVTVD